MSLIRLLVIFLLSVLTLPAYATNWYVRQDGGTRYTAAMPDGQCNGQSDAAYPGSGTNQSCAFKDVRYFWTDGSYCGDWYTPATQCWKWVGAGGDTYLVRGSVANGVSYRVGQDGQMFREWFGGVPGNPYQAPPPPPSGTTAQHTRILGENYASCSAPSARTQLHGGHGVGAIFNLFGTSYIDIACFDLTDFSSCGKSGQTHGCSTYEPLDDYADSAISMNNQSIYDTLTNIRIHGFAASGIFGATGNGVVLTNVDILGNATGGWNADNKDGTTGTGTLLMQKYNISWNGCAEEYPIVSSLPYQDCTDEDSGGYGDGFGTATVASNPAWTVKFDQGVVSYNTQDGLDALHLVGVGSSMTISRTRAFGNMGQQIKVGGAAGVAENNIITTNCNAMRQAIPGTPSGYNSRLSTFCRAADAGVVITTGKNSTVTFQNNTLYSASSTAVELGCDETNGACDSTSKGIFRNNIFVGFLNNATNGYVGGGTGDYSNPIYFRAPATVFQNAGSSWTNNYTYHPKSNWQCPNTIIGEQNGSCADPQLTDETWHVYGDANVTPLASSPVVGAGVSIASLMTDFYGGPRPNPPTIGALEPARGTNPTFTPAVMASPAPGGILTGSTATFTWLPASDPAGYQIYIGSTLGGLNYFSGNPVYNTNSQTISGIPTDGSTIYVRLFSRANDTWYYNDYTYTAFNAPVTPGMITSPVPGGTLPGSTVTFTWSSASIPTGYQIYIGSSPGGINYYSGNPVYNTNSQTISGLPTDGSTVYVRLMTATNQGWINQDYTYTAATQP